MRQEKKKRIEQIRAEEERHERSGDGEEHGMSG